MLNKGKLKLQFNIGKTKEKLIQFIQIITLISIFISIYLLSRKLKNDNVLVENFNELLFPKQMVSIFFDLKFIEMLSFAINITSKLSAMKPEILITVLFLKDKLEN